MTLDVRACFEGRPLEFSGELSLAEYEFFGEKPFAEPVLVTGEIANRAGIVTLRAQVSTTLHLVCGRCADPFLRTFEQEVSVVLTESLNNPEEDYDGELVLVSDGLCDVDEILVPALILEMDIKNLCREDCCGLCPKCGFNLNNGVCGCDNREIDPRLAKLGQYLDK